MACESRNDLLNWLNELLQLNIAKIEQCGTGAALCQVMDSIYGTALPCNNGWRRRSVAKGQV